MKVSVIIPNYNHSLYLRQRIDSVLQQTFSDFEVIILDDCSTDDSRQIIETYRSNSKVSVVNYNEENSGSPFIQWAKGIELAQGEYIWIAESDDWCDVNFLEEIIPYTVKYPQAGLLYCNTRMITDNDTYFLGPIVNEDYLYFPAKSLIQERLMNGLSINNASAVLFKRKFSTLHLSRLIQFKKHGDYFFWIQIANEGEGVFINKVLNYCRILESSVTRKAFHISPYSLTEHIEIFKLLNSLKKYFPLKKQLLFYDCWGLSFLHFFKKMHYTGIRKQYKKMFYASRCNLYFFARYLYFTLKSR